MMPGLGWQIHFLLLGPYLQDYGTARRTASSKQPFSNLISPSPAGLSNADAGVAGPPL